MPSRVLSSSISTKLLVGITGLGLFVYLLIHIVGNLMVFLGPAAFNTSSDQALESLGKLEGIEARVVLFGHGDPWNGGVDAARA